MRSEARAAGEPRAGGELAGYVHRTRVEWSDTDAGGHHHNTAVTRYVEAAEAELMRRKGLPEYFGTAPRVRFEADFTAPLWFGQEVTAILVLERIGRSSMTFRFEVWGEAHEGRERELAASGRYVTVHVPRSSPQTRGSEPWPAEWIKALQSDDEGGEDEDGAGDGT